MKRTITFTIIFLTFAMAVVTAQGKIDKKAIAEGLKSHDRALYIKEGWIRDPYIYLAPDGYYYLCGTVPNPTGFTKPNKPGITLRLWKSPDLIDWEEMDVPFTLDQGYWAEKEPELFKTVPRETWKLWAPEIYFFDGRWVFVHTSPSPVRQGADLCVSQGEKFTGPYSHPMKDKMLHRHDPSLFQDKDGTVYLVWKNTFVAPLKKDLSDFASEPVRIDPSSKRIGPGGDTLTRIGRGSWAPLDDSNRPLQALRSPRHANARP